MKRTHFFITLSLVILTSLSIFSCGTLDNASRSSSEQKSTKTSANDLYFHKDNIAEYLSKTFGEKIVTSGLDITSQDMTYTIRDGELQSIILGEWNRRYMFHGVKVGDSITDAHAKLKTGFTGTPLILLTLFDNGMDEYAYRILYNQNYPGWSYAINLGATTIWERWNSLLENGTISGNGMNSFNHYAYGSVCETIYSRIAGLRNLSPGWKKVKIKPHINYRIKNMDFAYDSISGRYEIKWKIENNIFYINIIIPYGCAALVELPDGNKFSIKEGIFNYNCKVDKNILEPDINGKI